VQHPLRRPSVLIWVVGAGGRGRGFFFQAVFGVESGLSSVHWTLDVPCKFYLGAGAGGLEGRIYFPFSQ